MPIHIKDDILIPILFFTSIFISLTKLFIIIAIFIDIFLLHIHLLLLSVITNFINQQVLHMVSLYFYYYFEIFFLMELEILLWHFIVFLVNFLEKQELFFDLFIDDLFYFIFIIPHYYFSFHFCFGLYYLIHFLTKELLINFLEFIISYLLPLFETSHVIVIYKLPINSLFQKNNTYIKKLFFNIYI